MSHNVEYEGVAFKDLALLEKAINELAKEGNINVEFRKDGSVPIRGWRGSAGEGTRYGVAEWDRPHDHTCPVGALFPDEKYDLGFNLNAEGEYVPFAESSWRTPFAADVGAETVSGDGVRTSTTHAMPGQTGTGGLVGKLTQRYAILLAEKNARIKGINTRRVNGSKGQMHLVATVR